VIHQFFFGERKVDEEKVVKYRAEKNKGERERKIRLNSIKPRDTFAHKEGRSGRIREEGPNILGLLPLSYNGERETKKKN